MRIGVIADTHIPDRAKRIPEQVIDAFKTVDMVIHAGDLVVLNVLDDLKKSCPDVRAVSGNMDCIHVRSEFPEKLLIRSGEVKIGVMHGSGAPDSLIDMLKKVFNKDKVDLIIFGHSHHALNEKKSGITFFNPGSPTDKVFSPYNSYGIIDIDGSKIDARIIKL